MTWLIRWRNGSRAEFGSRILTHVSGTRESVVEVHRSGSAPTILFAVNMHEGLDLIDSLARFLVIPKVLYTGKDEWVKERERLDPGFYERATCQRMVQACGRVVRSQDDWSNVYILDHLIWALVRKNPAEFPRHFHAGIRAGVLCPS